MKHDWLEKFLERIADRGREFLQLWTEKPAVPRLGSLCRALLSGVGEATGTALSREVLRAYERMDRDGRKAFFEMLATEFGPDASAIRAAAEEYIRLNDANALLRLMAAVEPPRQELFRRINMAPKGTAALVAMRAELLGLLPQHPELKVVDADMRHLLASWFNRGFLRLERIDWHSPADLLEKIIRYDMVQTIKSWDDLRRRLAADRRCFAFFHPALPDEPLIILEVALVHGMADKVTPLLDDHAPVLQAKDANTAMFISINSTQHGLRGLSFGNLLIKQVAEDLQQELPHLKNFATLSPLPMFAATLRAAVSDTHREFSRARLEALLQEYAESLRQASGGERPAEALLTLLTRAEAPRAVLAAPLERVALAYLSLLPREPDVFDPVARFHLSNGARLERINVFADESSVRQEESFRVMVNYLYDPDEVIANHEGFVGSGHIAMSRSLQREQKKLAAIWNSVTR
ncbi:MAG TPA: malonyl-CoA decarboxylase family protein [Sulfuricaulis sp.]|nr:malonyl-CoA decarboxylase family protein [Sulfuricaulis sp.]